MATYGEILGAAYNHSSKLVPNITVFDAVEGLAMARRALHGLWAWGARINQDWFSSVPAVVAHDGTLLGWPRPADAMIVYLILKNTTAEEVLPVQREEAALFSYRPAVYREGVVYKPAHTDPGPTHSLRFHFSRWPATPAALTDPVDTMWPSQFDELFAIETAIFMLLKDGRIEEASQLRVDRDRWLSNLGAFLSMETVGVRVRNVRPENALQPALALPAERAG